MNYRTIMKCQWLWLLFAAGCACTPRLITQTQTLVKDSVIVREVIKTVPVTVEKDSVVLTLKQETRGTFEKKNKRARVQVTVDSKGNISASANCDSVTKLLTLKLHETERLHTEQVKETIEKIVYKTRDIDKFCRWATAATAAGTILYFGIKRVRNI